jgi:hypothetical protein
MHVVFSLIASSSVDPVILDYGITVYMYQTSGKIM